MQDQQPSMGTKSAVVLSPEGKIERHIDEHQAEANDAFAAKQELVIVYDNVSSKTKHFFKRFSNHYLGYLLLSNIAVAILVSAYTHSGDVNIATLESQPDVTTLVNEQDPRPIAELKQEANRIIQDNQWTIGHVDDFVMKWNHLDEALRQEFSNSFWFERFTNLFEEKLLGVNATGPSNTAKTAYADALFKMAATIGIAGPDESLSSDYNIDDIVKDLSSEIAKVEAESKNASQDNVAATNVINDQTQNQSTTSDVEENKAQIAAVKRSMKGFTERDAHYLLGQYATTYQFGSTNKIMELFSTNKSYTKALSKNFKKVFSYSSKRQIEFSDLVWTFQENDIVGKGKYKAVIKLKKNEGTRFVDADIRVKIRAAKNNLRIARMDFSNVTANLIKPKHTTKQSTQRSTQQSNRNNVKEAPEKLARAAEMPTLAPIAKPINYAPTAAELQDVITRFVSAYESGNLGALDTLFTQNAETNDKHGLNGIKQDYKKLFTSTSERQLFINNLRWSYDKNKAIGTGLVSALVVAEGSKKISTLRGEVKITAKKDNNQVLISRLYHRYEK